MNMQVFLSIQYLNPLPTSLSEGLGSQAQPSDLRILDFESEATDANKGSGTLGKSFWLCGVSVHIGNQGSGGASISAGSVDVLGSGPEMWVCSCRTGSVA